MGNVVNVVVREVDSPAARKRLNDKPQDVVPHKSNRRGNEKRRSYTSSFKAEVIADVEAGENVEEVILAYFIWIFFITHPKG